MEAVRPRSFRLEPIPAARAMLYVRRATFLKFDLFVGFLGFVIMFALLGPARNPVSTAAIAFPAMAAGIFIGRWLRPIRVAARMRSPAQSALLAERSVEIDARGLRWSGEGVSSDVEWKLIQRLVRTPSHLGFEFAGQVFLVPVAAFAKGEIERTGEFARAAGVRVEELRR